MCSASPSLLQKAASRIKADVNGASKHFRAFHFYMSFTLLRAGGSPTPHVSYFK